MGHTDRLHHNKPTQPRSALNHLRPWYPKPTKTQPPIKAQSIARKTAVQAQAQTFQAKPPSKPTPRPAQPPVENRQKQSAMPLVIAALFGMGILLYSITASEIVIGIYALIAFGRHIESRVTFRLALASLGLVILLLIVSPTWALVETVAEYTFLLFIVGTISLIIETRRTALR